MIRCDMAEGCGNVAVGAVMDTDGQPMSVCEPHARKLKLKTDQRERRRGDCPRCGERDVPRPGSSPSEQAMSTTYPVGDRRIAICTVCRNALTRR